MKKLIILLTVALFASVANSEEIVFKTSTGQLHGTLETPESSGPRSLVLIISGSGPTDRDGNVLGLQGKTTA